MLDEVFPTINDSSLKKIAKFRQQDGENLYEAWERYNEMLRRCPQHNIVNDQVVSYFYYGLQEESRIFIDSSTGGSVFDKTETEGIALIERIINNTFNWPADRFIAHKIVQAIQIMLWQK